MTTPATHMETASDFLNWIDHQQLAGSLTASVVAHLTTLSHGQEIVYRESSLQSGHDFVRGTITVLTERHLFLVALVQDPGGSAIGSVSVDVFARSALRRIHVEGQERMHSLDYDFVMSRDGRDNGTRPLRLVLTYQDGPADERTVTLQPHREGHMRGPVAFEAQTALVASLLADLAR